MTASFAGIGSYLSRLMSGGTVEIILLIVLIIVALILFLVLLWVLWKLLVLLGKGLLWLFRWSAEAIQGKSAARREARLAAPPPVATGWGSPPRIGLRRALAEARRLAGPDALRIVVAAGQGTGDLCRSLGLTPPGVGAVGIAADDSIVLVDATTADTRMLRRLAAALPWRRPVDAVGVLVDSAGMPGEALARAALFARATGMRTALHFVLPSSGSVAAWCIVDANNKDGSAICSRLAADTTRIWLAGGPREGLKELALAQSRELSSALDRALAVAPSSVIDIASLSFSGSGFKAAVAQTIERTRPASAPGLTMWTGIGILAAGFLLAILATVVGLQRAEYLHTAVDTAEREAAVSWTAEGIETVPSSAKVRRVSALSVRLAELSSFSPLMPFASLAPNHSAPEALGAAFLEGYVLLPLAVALDRQAEETLAPSDDPARWLEDARRAGEWFAAWEALADDPREVDLQRLFAAAFGSQQSAWAEGTDIAFADTGVKPPPPARGGLDVDRLTKTARANFVVTMQRWADSVYTNGPVAVAARRAGDRSTNWREQHAALLDLRTALQDPSQQWLTAAQDRPDHLFELRILGRAVGMSLIGQLAALESKAAVSSIRIDARAAAEYFLLPRIGPLMVRSSTGGQAGGGPSLSMTPEAVAWLAFLDRIANAGFADLPSSSPAPIVGLATLDVGMIAATRQRIRVFDQFASDLPSGLPPAVAQDLIRELASELVVGLAVGVEQALRPTQIIGVASDQAERLVRVAPALDDLADIQQWLSQRQAEDEVDRVWAVRARVAETVLVASAATLVEEDPLGIYLDPAADRNAAVRRFERGLSRLQRTYRQLAEPFIEAAEAGGGWAAVAWRNMANDIAAHERGDAASTLSGLEGMLRAYAEDPQAACTAPRPTMTGRDDYLANTLSRFRQTVADACAARLAAESRLAYDKVVDYFDKHVAWLRPYSTDANAPELAPSTLSDFATLLHEVRVHLDRVDEPFAGALAQSADFWTRGKDGGAVVRFRIDWRSRPSEEFLAENIMAVDFYGIEVDEAGVHTWRYGSTAGLRLRLAKNSRYRFVASEDAEGRQLAITEDGNGALLRVFSSLSNGALVISAEILDDLGKQYTLRLTARVSRADGAPMKMPAFSQWPLMRL